MGNEILKIVICLISGIKAFKAFISRIKYNFLTTTAKIEKIKNYFVRWSIYFLLKVIIFYLKSTTLSFDSIATRQFVSQKYYGFCNISFRAENFGIKHVNKYINNCNNCKDFVKNCPIKMSFIIISYPTQCGKKLHYLTQMNVIIASYHALVHKIF